MTILATQTAVGGVGRKATTVLSMEFDDMINIGGFQFGGNSEGIFRMNSGDTDNGEIFTSSFTLATTDAGIKNPKRVRAVYLGFDGDEDLTVSVTVDEGIPREYTETPLKSGLQRLKVPIGSDGQGRYWKVKIISDNYFRIDKLDGLFIVRPSGIRGY